jgi:hypothetical protein
VVDGDEAGLIDEIHFFHWLAEAQAEVAVFGFQLRAVDFDPLIGVGDVVGVGRDPVADDGCADGVGDEFVLASIPGEDDGAGTAAAV